MALTNFRAGGIPNPPAQWDPQYMRQVIRVLELYFSQLDSNTPNFAQTYTADYFYGSGIHLTFPYGQFTSNSDQTAANTYTAYVLTYSQSDFEDGVTWSNANPSRMIVPHAGIYKVTYSIQLRNTTNDVQDFDVWLRKNGSDVAETNSQFSLPARKSTGSSSHLIAVTSLMVELAANDYVELAWKVTNVGVNIEHFAAVAANPGVTPAVPATPAAIVQVEFVSLI